ncbi:MAG: hypothetical protein RLY93_07010 [Sumerlaeia bacterium]
MRTAFTLLTSTLLATAATASVGTQPPDSASSAILAVEPEPAWRDAPLEAYRRELFALAFEVASAIPHEPHIKTRSRMQEQVVETALALDQPTSAVAFVRQIDNWRRAHGNAMLAYYWADAGNKEMAQEFLKAAQDELNSAEDWRRDRVRVKIAQTYLLLGQDPQAKLYSTNLVESERGKVEGIAARTASEEDFLSQASELDMMLAMDDQDINKNALDSYGELFGRHYDNEELRAEVVRKVKASSEKLPVFMRLEMLADLAKQALAHDDRETALILVDEAQSFLTDFEWAPRYHVEYWGLVIGLRAKAGDVDTARTLADETLAYYGEKGPGIVNIYRAQALRSLAEAYAAIGDEEKALEVYKLAVEEGFENPNSRPRAEDLSQTLTSMARVSVEPDAVLWTRVRQIAEGLGAPW